MKFGIYYAYWEKEWHSDYVPYIEKVKRLGFDVLEVACGGFGQESLHTMADLGRAAKDHEIMLTGGYGPRREHNLATESASALKDTFHFYRDVFNKMEAAGIRSLGGALYSYWPVDFASGFDDKAGDFARSAANMRLLADMAADHGIMLNMEALNRFEGYLINTCEEAVAYVEAVDHPNVKLMLDTFHMNIEEDSMDGAIEAAGKLLGHFHVGEANRRPPRRDGRIPWKEIVDALKKTGYDGCVVMEPFVMMGGQVGKDIYLWRDISNGATSEELDRDAALSLAYLRELFARGNH